MENESISLVLKSSFFSKGLRMARDISKPLWDTDDLSFNKAGTALTKTAIISGNKIGREQQDYTSKMKFWSA